MPYTIFTLDQVIPRTKTVPGPQNTTREMLNPGPDPVYPEGSQVVYSPPDLDIYSENPAVRMVLLEDPNGEANGSQIFEAFPLIREVYADKIRAEGDRRLDLMANTYFENERKTWDLQQKQAEQWLSDNTSPCTTIRTMAAERGISVGEMVNKIMENIPVFELEIGTILGRQQRLLDKLYATTDYEELRGISWE